jgi:CIC family chloride channel protein
VAITALRVAPSWVVRLGIVTILVGIGSGVSGLVVSLALHALEHLAYGYSSGTFLDGVIGASPARRVIALGIAGVTGALGWWALRRWARPVVSVEASVAGERMPKLVTVANTALQVVIVGLGASIGREVAPRELGAMVGGWLSERAGLSARERSILVACGAGAGLAAVYDVPLSGAVFAVEILLAELTLATALPALATAAIATLVAQLVVPAGPLYALPTLTLTPTLLVWCVVAGPVIGFAALGFVSATRWALAHRVPGKWILLAMPLIFLAVGFLAIPFPAILGNGRALGQVAFDGAIPLLLMAALLVVKAVATTGTIYSGAAGGTLTPSLALGAALGAVLGAAWSLMWPGSPVAAFAYIAAAAFLASSMRAPFTALILILEFTGEGPALLAPTMVAIAGSVAVTYFFNRGRISGAA